MQKSEVLRIAGDFAFEYGFFAGHEDFRLCTDPTADIYVTYAHRSLEEFFGSFGFLQALADGKSVDDILGSDCEQPIFMMNPLVLRFSLWLLNEKLFNFPQNIYLELVLFAVKQIDFHRLDTMAVEWMYPAMRISEAFRETESLKLKFFKHILEKCQHVHVLIIRAEGGCNYEQVDGVLGFMNPSLLSKLTYLSITGLDSPPFTHQDPFTILIDSTDPDTLHKYLNILLPKYNLLKIDPQVYASVHYRRSESCDLSTLITKHIKQLHLIKDYTIERDSPATLFSSDKFSHCPQLTRVTLVECRTDDSVPSSLIKAVQNGDLPHLKRIELSNCRVNDCEWPKVPEFSFKTIGKFNLSHMQKLLSKLAELGVYHPSDIDLVIPVHLENLSVLNLRRMDSYNLQQINRILEKGKVPNLSNLSVSVLENGVRLHKFLDNFVPNQIVKLQKLALWDFMISVEDLKILSKILAVRLTKLDLSWSSGFTGNLSVLFTHSFSQTENSDIEELWTERNRSTESGSSHCRR